VTALPGEDNRRPTGLHRRSASEEAAIEQVSALLAGSCADILKHKIALWTFVDHDGIEPNNYAERELRGLVVTLSTAVTAATRGINASTGELPRKEVPWG
jgi:hypothetical protein